MSIEDFIELTRLNPDEWYHYCEIILDNDGSVILARPSQEALIKYYCDRNNITRNKIIEHIPIDLSPTMFIIDKYTLVSVWYNMIICSFDGLNGNQSKSLDMLVNNGLIMSDFVAYPTNEYKLYLERKNIGLYD